MLEDAAVPLFRKPQRFLGELALCDVLDEPFDADHFSSRIEDAAAAIPHPLHAAASRDAILGEETPALAQRFHDLGTHPRTVLGEDQRVLRKTSLADKFCGSTVKQVCATRARELGGPAFVVAAAVDDAVQVPQQILQHLQIKVAERRGAASTGAPRLFSV